MNAFDTTGPSLTAPTKSEQGTAKMLLKKSRKVEHMSIPKGDVFCPPITTQKQADRTNAIRGR